jgi:hypothetical protein
VTRGDGICRSKSNAALGIDVVVAFEVVVLSGVEVFTVVVATGCTDEVEAVFVVAVVFGVVGAGGSVASAARALVVGGVTVPSTTLLRRTVAVGPVVWFVDRFVTIGFLVVVFLAAA